MNLLSITTYRGYSKVNGSMPIEQWFCLVCGKAFRDKVLEIRRAEEEGDCAKADHMKSQLAYFTLTANYNEVRLPYSLVRHNDIITLDIDKMKFAQIPFYRKLVNEDPATLGSFISPRAHGLKLFVYLRSEEAERMCAELNARGTIDYADLEKYHHSIYTLVRKHYETLLGTEADESGSDLSRGFYASYDPDAFLSVQRLADVKPLEVEVNLPKKGEKKKRKSTSGVPEAAKEDAAANISAIDQQVLLNYRKALEYTNRKYRFEQNSRDMFLYCLGNQCYRHHILESETLQLVRRDFGNEPNFDVEQPIRNAYTYTTKSDQAEEEDKKPMIQKVVEFLDHQYEFRRNVVLDRLEFRQADTASVPFVSMRNKDLNTIYVKAQFSSVFCNLKVLKAVIDSDYASPFHPFISYLRSLKPWDGVTDYIGQMAATVMAEDQAFFEDSLRHWMVGLVAGAIDENVQNHQLLLLYSRQGKGKSIFARKLLPPELREYYRNGMINAEKTDHMLQLSSCFIINLDEYDGVSPSHVSDLKRIITQDVVTERKVYDLQTYGFIRRASFVGTTNNLHCLQDIGQNRRVLFNCIRTIDYRAKFNYEGIYAQAYALYRQGFKFWYEGKEVDELNLRNERYRLKDPVEENLFFYFRAATVKDTKMKWLPASHLLSTLSLNGRIQSNRQTLQILVTVLEMNDFRKRITKEGVMEYAVVEYSLEEREKKAVLPQLPQEGALGL